MSTLTAAIAATSRLDEATFLDYQTRIWSTLGPDAAPNAFERATGRALWRAVLHAWEAGESPKRFTTLSAATGSGKTLSALALAAYLAEQAGLRVTILESQINQLGSLYMRLQALLDPSALEQVAVWSSAHRADAGAQARDTYHRMATKDTEDHFKDPPRFTESDCRKARILLTTHAAWKSELAGGRSLDILKSDLVIVDEDASFARVFTFTSATIAALARSLRVGNRRGFAGEFPPQALEVVERAQKLAASIEEDSNLNRVRLKSAPIVTEEDLDVLTEIDPRQLKKAARDAGEDFEEVWSTLVALKAAGQGMAFYTSWASGGRCFFAYASAVGPQPNTVILDASSAYSSGTLSDSVYMVDGVPTADYSNVDLHLVYEPEFRGKLRPRGLYANRDGSLQVYGWLLKFIEAHAVPDKPVLVYAKKDFLNMLDSDEKNPEELAMRTGGRPVHFVHFGTGRGFNEWKDCETYIRLADFYLSREDAIASTGSVLNRVFTYADLNALSSGKARDPEVEAMVRLRLLSSAMQDAARSALRGLDGNGRPTVPVKMFLVDPDPVVVQSLKTLWPGIPDPKVIGDPGRKPTNKGSGLRAIKAALAFLEKREKQGTSWGTKDIEKATGAHRNHVSRLLRNPHIAERLKRNWEKESAPGKPWKYHLRGAPVL